MWRSTRNHRWAGCAAAYPARPICRACGRRALKRGRAAFFVRSGARGGCAGGMDGVLSCRGGARRRYLGSVTRRPPRRVLSGRLPSSASCAWWPAGSQHTRRCPCCESTAMRTALLGISRVASLPVPLLSQLLVDVLFAREEWRLAACPSRFRAAAAVLLRNPPRSPLMCAGLLSEPYLGPRFVRGSSRGPPFLRTDVVVRADECRWGRCLSNETGRGSGRGSPG